MTKIEQLRVDTLTFLLEKLTPIVRDQFAGEVLNSLTMNQVANFVYNAIRSVGIEYRFQVICDKTNNTLQTTNANKLIISVIFEESPQINYSIEIGPTSELYIND